MLRAIVIVLTISLTLVLLPIAINVATGGTVPVILERYVGWAWPAIGLLWVIAIVTGLVEVRSRRTGAQWARSADQPRNRPNALDRVERYLDGRFAGSLASRTRLALDLDERVGAGLHPYDLLVRPLGGIDSQVREGGEIGTVFDELQDSMLILGAPGAGKTTLLLDLARSLVAHARNDRERPIPVLVDLAGWAGSGASQAGRPEDDDPADSTQLAVFVHWLLGELTSRYQIPAPVGRVWLRNGQLALLLDGLDEVAIGHRDRLAPVLEELRRRYMITQLAVTCRTQDYERLPQQLRLYGTVGIRPLSRRRVLDYFAAVGPELAGARAAIEQDEDLWGLVDSPLMLNVMALAYQGRDARDIVAGDVADHRRELFDTYVSEVLARRRPATGRYSSRTTMRSLWCLARWTRMGEGDRIALPRRLPPGGWYGMSLPEVSQLGHMICLPALLAGFVGGVTLAVAALFGVPAGFGFGLIGLILVHLPPRTWRVFRRRPEQPRALIAALVISLGAIVGLVFGLAAVGTVTLLPTWLGLGLLAVGAGVAYLKELAEMTRPTQRWRRRLLGLRLVVVGLVGALAASRAPSPDSFVQACVLGLIGVEGVRLIKRLPMDQLERRDSSREYVDGPRFRWRMDPWVGATALGSLLIATVLGASAGVTGPEQLLGLLLGVMAGQGWDSRGHRIAETVSRLLHGLMLRWTSYLPWRRRAFLQYAADRHVLARTGQGRRFEGEQYAFIHLLVRDHLAECDPDTLAAKVDRRKAARGSRAGLTRSH
ncbi:NACHT domain-containing protein [Kribbella qitaiheensis]|uniref:NACHT domain-containing protein n=1 Tax=Kribbella qitaiheensis TaxID=1544730 RepID=A0A7G6X9Z6_9ACTN|nr:NACHT domain-containing protein [Kribbella qitaiheensis]